MGPSHSENQTPALQVRQKREPDIEIRLIDLLTEIAGELRPGFDEPVTLDSDLTADLGLDSLARTEALLRIQRAFDIHLPDSALLAATPRELLRLARATSDLAATATPSLPLSDAAAEAPTARSEPREAQTLLDVLAWHEHHHPDRQHVTLLTERGAEPSLSYGELAESARRVAGGLQQVGLQPGDTVIIMLPTGYPYLACFMGALIAGGVPVPIYPPARASQVVAHLRRHRRILENAGAQFLIVDPIIRRVADALRPYLQGLRQLLIADELLAGDLRANPYRASPADTAMLQYTSGSTGDPKGVVLSHANLLANIRAAGARLRAGSGDVFVTWLPLYHDMGLIGAWLGSLYFATPVILMSPLHFLAQPSRWLWAIHEYRGTISAAPNFAYELCLREIRDEEIEGLQLESWRHALNGAEPVNPRAVQDFCTRFAANGFRAEAMKPAYGLAEACVGLTIPDDGSPPAVDRVDRQSFESGGVAEPAATGDQAQIEFISCGRPLAGHEIRVVDVTEHELPERHEGRLQFRGPSATVGYYRNPEATKRLIQGDWLDTGDRAYVADGLVFVTGRVKDMIIRGGRNIHPSELDAAIGEIPGVLKDGVAAFGCPGPGGGERLVIVAETRETEPAARNRLVAAINRRTADLLAMPPDDVVLAPPQSILKTPSGKVQRAATCKLYERGTLGKAPRMQSAVLAASLVAARLRTWLATAAIYGYSAWAWFSLLLVGTATWSAVVLLPRMSWRWLALRVGARSFLSLARITVRIRGQEHLPKDRTWILASNHTSYLDGLLLATALNGEVAFLAKRELQDHFLTRVFLRRLNALYVDRSDLEASTRAPEAMVKAIEGGRCVMVFPEGTFVRQPGVLPFRMGAFLTAAITGVDVVPVALRGVRNILRPSTWLIRSGSVLIYIDSPIPPAGNDWTAAVQLRDTVRAVILRNSGEPDAATASG